LSLPFDGWKWLVVFSRMNGAKNIGPNNEPIWDNAEMVETLEFFSDLYQQNVTLDVSIWQEMQLGHIFKGKAAMGYATPSSIAETVREGPNFADKLGFMHIGRQTTGAWCGAAFLFISGESQNKDEAWNYMKFFWEPDEMWERYKKIGAPTLRKSMAARYNADDPLLNTHLQQYVGVGVGAPKVPWAGPYLFKYLPQAQQDAFYGKKSPQQALIDAVADLEKELALTK
jgi:ABC-type glycerol-3-phosphate transport system substrate-binding protein